MSEEILINVTPRETRVALVENGVLQEVYIERARRRGLRWRILAVCQGVIGDCCYFQGVRDEARDRDEFHALVGTE